jgi:hypothetical protein
VEISANFLFYLQPAGAKAAYRRQAMATHPDRSGFNDPGLLQCYTAQFRDVAESYELIRRFFKQREEGLWSNPETSCRRTGTSHFRTPRTGAPAGSVYYHQGPMPQRYLTLGRYLYYQGKIPYHAILEAVNWQRRQRPVIGTLARNWGWLSEADVRAILVSTHIQGLFGEKALHLGLLSSYQVRLLLVAQRSRQEKIGQYFVQKGFISQHSLAVALKEQHRHNASQQQGRHHASHP